VGPEIFCAPESGQKQRSLPVCSCGLKACRRIARWQAGGSGNNGRGRRRRQRQTHIAPSSAQRATSKRLTPSPKDHPNNNKKVSGRQSCCSPVAYETGWRRTKSQSRPNAKSRHLTRSGPEPTRSQSSWKSIEVEGKPQLMASNTSRSHDRRRRKINK
jgi:hypothetical protein